MLAIATTKFQQQRDSVSVKYNFTLTYQGESPEVVFSTDSKYGLCKLYQSTFFTC